MNSTNAKEQYCSCCNREPVNPVHLCPYEEHHDRIVYCDCCDICTDVCNSDCNYFVEKAGLKLTDDEKKYFI